MDSFDHAKDRERMELYNQGLTDEEIASIVGVKITTIGQWRRGHKLSPHIKKKIDHIKKTEDRIDGLDIFYDEIGIGKDSMPFDAEESFQYAISISEFDDRTVDIMIERYLNGKTFDDIGKKYDITKQRVRQICMKVVRKIRRSNSLPLCVLRYGIALYENAYNEWISERNDRIQKCIDEISSNDIEYKSYLRKINEQSPISLDTSIVRLNLSTRLYNCLNISGYRTIESLQDISLSDLMSIRNMGSTTIRELFEKMTVYGFDFPWMKELRL